MYIYFIYNSRAQIKIGFSKDPNKRLAQLQTSNSNELQLIGYFEGDRAREKKVHKDLEQYHTRGEWYAASRVLDYIAELNPAIWIRLNPADLRHCPRRCKWGHTWTPAKQRKKEQV